MMNHGIYIHIPFCSTKCGYCDFYSLSLSCLNNKTKPDNDIIGLYHETIITEIQNISNNIIADTLYIGGGTPTLLGGKLVNIIYAAKNRFSLSSNAEITVEANPDSVSLPLLCELSKAGVNRISFGLQSANENELHALGRTHTANDVENAVNTAKTAGINNISIDIMLGIPYQTQKSLNNTLDFIKKLGIQHISAYILKIEPGVPLAKESVLSHCPDDDTTSDLYLYTVKYLEKLSLKQYEISNFAIENHKSRHNLKYWTLAPYIGIGVSAHSFDGKSRFTHSNDINSYIKNWKSDITCYDENAGGFDEYSMLSLRLATGLDCDIAEKNYGVNKNVLLKKAQDIYNKNRAEPLVELDGNTIKLTPKGFLVSNNIIKLLSEF